MGALAKFSIEDVLSLRNKAREANSLKCQVPQGWSKSKQDPTQLLSVFSSLKIKKGFTLRRL